jgi:hypothetical protein
VNHLAAVEGLKAEAADLLQRVATTHPTDDVGVIQEFAAVARLRELARQLGWGPPETAELAELYDLRDSQVRTIIEEGR